MITHGRGYLFGIDEHETLTEVDPSYAAEAGTLGIN